jgi:hypothetical protein
MIVRAIMLATLAQRQWKHPDDSRNAKEPCGPRALRNLGLPSVAAALWSINDRPQRNGANVYRLR